MRILILEDNAERRTVMLEHLAHRFPMFAVTFFDSSDRMIRSIEQGRLKDVIAISLDNDLEPLGYSEGRAIDAGDGLAVMKSLLRLFPHGRNDDDYAVPVLIHSTNGPAAESMVEQLLSCGWHVSRVVPYDAENWIGEIWIQKMQRLIITNVTDVRAMSARQ